jgi:hypothetical protein
MLKVLSHHSVDPLPVFHHSFPPIPMRTILKGGLLIGLANLIWLYLGFYLGLHTNGIAVFQIFMTVWLAITIVGFVMVLRAVLRDKPDITYFGSLGAGILVSVVTAVIAVVAQIGYFKVVHPEWPDVMAKQAEEHFMKQGASAEEVAKEISNARSFFTLEYYAASSAMTAVIVGTFLSAVISGVLFFMRSRGPRKLGGG